MADPTIITSVSSVQVPEGGQATFNVRLSSRPRRRSVDVNTERVSGDANIGISSGREITFSRRNYNRWKTVTLTATEDSDHTNGQASFRLSGEGVTAATVRATEVDNDSTVNTYQIVTDRNTMNVMEGGTAAFQVKLTADPGQSVSVTVGHDSGDPDLSVVSGLTYLFDSSNWDEYQPITVAAAEDGDDTGGQATFALSAAGTQTVYVNASEQDNDNGGTPPGRVVIDPVSRIEGHLRIEVEVSDGTRHQSLVHRHLVPWHRNHFDRPRCPRRTPDHPAPVWCVHLRPRPGLCACHRGCPGGGNYRQRPHHPQPDARRPVPARPHRPFLSPSRAGLGRHYQCLERRCHGYRKPGQRHQSGCRPH